MDILSTLKTEYSRTLILIVIPGAIALYPFSIILYNYINIHVENIENFFIYFTIIYLFATLFVGFIIQDLGARAEVQLDKKFCSKRKKDHSKFNYQFVKYLFNKKEEEYIITHYYRSLLVRLKFELHSVIAIIVLWIGMILRFIIENYQIDLLRTVLFIVISLSVVIYLLCEAYAGVALLHLQRLLINRKFSPRIK